MQLSLNLDLARLYNELDEKGKDVLLSHLTAGMGEGVFRAALIAQWTAAPAPVNNGDNDPLQETKVSAD